MWRLLSKIFGIHYVLLKSPVMNYTYIRRVRRTVSGNMYINFCGHDIWFLLATGKVDNGYTWTPLTWTPEPETEIGKGCLT
jgi:hypothetical protein